MKTIDKLVLARKRLAACEKKIEQATSMLVREWGKRPGLQRAVIRLHKRLSQEELAKETPEVIKFATPEPAPIAKPAPLDPADDLSIPGFLQQKTGAQKDAEARAAIEAENTARKQAKSRGRVEKMLAKRDGRLNRMPPSGKEALAIIRGG